MPDYNESANDRRNNSKSDSRHDTGGAAKRPIKLPEDRNKAIDKLFDQANFEKTRALREKELPVFQLYLNYAVTNIQYFLGMEERNFCLDSIESHLRKRIQKRQDSKQWTEKDEKEDLDLYRLANFFWLFKVDDPEQDYGLKFEKDEKDYRFYALALAKKVFDLRTFFCHPLEKGIQELIADRKFYEFFAGDLCRAAREKALKPGMKSAKVFEMKLMNPQDINDDDRTKTTYAFTRKGIILLICMALFKDDAEEFLQSLHDMKLPTHELQEDGNSEEFESVRKKAPSAKAFHEFFTYYSLRRGYGAINSIDHSIDHDFSCFADIVGYLNKVPIVSLEYLALDNERQMLEKKKAESVESDENKESKYKLQRRFKNRFLTFLAGYCEDFAVTPSLHFKRLDISEKVGRKRYCFGIKNDNSNGQDRHFAIEQDAIRFEFCPKKHYGAIHIDHLRSAIGATALRNVLLAHVGEIFNAEEALSNYFTAYHKILEKMLNEPECDFIDREKYMDELQIVTGAPAKILRDDNEFRKVMAPYFPENLTRFFIPEDNIPSEDILHERLLRGLNAEINRDEDVLNRFSQFTQYQIDCRKYHEKLDREGKDEKDPENAKDKPKFPKGCRFSDGFFVNRVFDLLNLYLPDNCKFRQLPRGKQHRGTEDFEYQTLHAIIGRVGKKAQPLWDFLEEKNTMGTRRRPELKPVSIALRNCFHANEAAVLKLYKDNGIGMNQRGKSAHGSNNPLMELARAAVMLHKRYCEQRKAAISIGMGTSSVDKDDVYLDRLDQYIKYDADRSKLPEYGSPEATSETPCRFSNDFCAERVFALLDLYLPDNHKLSQTIKDNENCKMLYTRLKMFASNQLNFWNYLCGPSAKQAGRFAELYGVGCSLQNRFNALRREIHGIDLIVILAKAAIELHKEYFGKSLKQSTAPATLDDIKADCRRFGIRLGMELSREAIFKTILHIDMLKWQKAFNYKEGREWQDRRLDTVGHIVTQIPLPNDFIITQVTKKAIKNNEIREAQCLKSNGQFDFNAYCRNVFIPNMTGNVSLRDFYDTRPLMNCLKTKDLSGTAWVHDLQEKFPKDSLEPTKSELEKAIREIKDVRNQDAVLLFIALKYHEKFAAKNSPAIKNVPDVGLSFSKCSSIYDYFENEEDISLDGLKMKLRPNDRLRPVFIQIRDSAHKLMETLSADEKEKSVDFYDLVSKFRRIQITDRKKRIEFCVKFMKLESRVDESKLQNPKDHDELFNLYRCSTTCEGLTREDFEFLIDFRNQIFHKGFAISDEDCAKADKVLRYFGIGVEDRR